jgi:tetratricopeptide (TPR) repeat protein/CHAT domain-containing protein
MVDDSSTLVLEIFKHENQLKMSVSEQKELAQTVRHYSQCSVAFEDVNKLSQEVIFILNKAGKLASVDSDLINSLKKTSHLLWDQLLTHPVKDRLKITIIKDLILSLDEELVSIPWEMLYDGNDFLGLKFNLGRLIRTRYQQGPPQYRSVSGKLKMLILANPTDDLKSAYLEGINIKNQFDKTRELMSIDFKSTHIDTLYVKKSLREYDIVHFAGHCEYERDNPNNTGWVLSDGRFTTQDILTLGGASTLPALVFSNACHTAQVAKNFIDLDYQAKTYSLASAFLFSGVRHYIGAVHKIEDPVGFVFAKEFYTQIIKGKSVGESVRLARSKLIEEYGINSILWANYILYGDPNFILFKQKSKAPALKPPKSFSVYKKHKKKLLGVLAAVAIITISLLLYKWLPTINPNTYILFNKSKNLFKIGKNEEVIQLGKRIIEKDSKFLDVYPLIANTYARLGERDEALKYYFDYVLNAQKRNDKKHLASSYAMIGWLYHQKGEYSKAFDFYDQALTLSRENKDRLNESIAMRKLAVWYMDKGDDNKALELLTKSSEINRGKQRNQEYKYNLACDYFDLGLLFVNKEDLNTAKEFYNKSLRLFKDMNLKNEMSDYYFNLGEIYLFEKQYQKALDNYMKGLKIDELQSNKVNIVSDYNMIGELYTDMDNNQKAEDSFKQAEKLAREIKAQPELAYVSYNLGLLYKKKGQKNRSREYFRQAQEIYRLIDTPDYKMVKAELLNLDN